MPSYPNPARARRRSVTTAAAVITLVLMVATASLASAAKPTGGSSGGGKPAAGGTSTISLVLLDSTDGTAHWGQNVRFEVSTTATTQPYVEVSCRRDGTVIYNAQTGYFDGYPWPWTQTFPLSSPSWTDGEADCTARLFWPNGRKTVTGATLAFHVFA